MAKLFNISASFRDPSGFVFQKDGFIYRQVNQSYKDNYDLLINSGLFQTLIASDLIVNHREVKMKTPGANAYKILRPEQLPFISYPYEWCFSELKDAALATLLIQNIALAHGMSLKDASAYNIAFTKNKPVLIDTLSFEKYKEGNPWVAYRQFCQHFLAPLALMSHVDLRLGQLSQLYLDGIPLDLTSRLLPAKTRFSFGLGTHIHLHARSQQSHAHDLKKNVKYDLGKKRLIAILDNLKSTISSLKLPKQKTTWQDYYHHTNYTAAAIKHKEEIVTKWIKKIKPKSVWDTGANDGRFSQIAAREKIFTVASDFDPLAIEFSYLQNKDKNEQFILPLIIDLTNPSPSIGWDNTERTAFLKRNSFELTLCLALVHHLAITDNLPFSYIAQLFAEHSQKLIIEFVPKNDSNTQRLLAHREDIFADYSQKKFEEEFGKFFALKERVKIRQSLRFLYLMERKK